MSAAPQRSASRYEFCSSRVLRPGDELTWCRTTLRSASFGYRVMSEPIRSDVLFDQKKGLKGAYLCRAGTCLALQVLAADCGHLITTPIG